VRVRMAYLPEDLRVVVAEQATARALCVLRACDRASKALVDREVARRRTALLDKMAPVPPRVTTHIHPTMWGWNRVVITDHPWHAFKSLSQEAQQMLKDDTHYLVRNLVEYLANDRACRELPGRLVAHPDVYELFEDSLRLCGGVWSSMCSDCPDEAARCLCYAMIAPLLSIKVEYERFCLSHHHSIDHGLRWQTPPLREW